MTNRLSLPSVTLCAVSSINIEATASALRASVEHVGFADCLFLTDAEAPEVHPAIRVVRIRRIQSARDYTNFMLHELVDHLRTEHCLVVQWDGFVISPKDWSSDFLDFDYVGAPWPQFSDHHDVGNGGFSLRSRKLLEACRDPHFRDVHPEDVAICRENRSLLEREYGISFADRETAGRFSFERTARSRSTFGFHGVFNMIDVLGVDRFWQIYSSLDDRSTAYVDYWSLMRQLKSGSNPLLRRAQLTCDRIRALMTE